MAVKVQGDRRLTVTEATTDSQNIHTRVNEHRGVRVSQCMERHAGQLQGNDSAPPCAADSVRLEQPPLYITEDERCCVWLAHAEQEAELHLVNFVGAQHADSFRG